MANELTVAETLTFAKNGVTATMTLSKQFNVSGSAYVHKAVSVPTSAGGTAIDVTGITTLGWFLMRNNDSTNNITIMTAVSGTNILVLKPGEAAMGRFDSGITAPAAISGTSPCILEYLLVDN